MTHKTVLAALCLAISSLAVPAIAQSTDASEQTAEELQEIFEQQKTRGLVIAPAPGTDTAPATSQAQVAKASVYTPVDAGTEINVRISFDFDSALLREDQMPKLATLCEAMTNMSGQVFRIVGHTDSKGSEVYNQNLSLLRASEVKRYMVNTCGIEEERLLAIGAGETHPVNDGDTTADENRRVEFQLIS
ncbi:OmpA family protein [Aliiruegeria sabulilitoris]|uniref:OmpA family protein n=1 Tax=Aliiruegeria sabulilitoris TaxID=1510458 RepID=UPI00083389EE|nr:OmpA family protein [Aliiruegeria sabulilitoris]NDR59031.1 OmpA family protein [Pseudoruegeria sp. M32A2M]